MANKTIFVFTLGFSFGIFLMIMYNISYQDMTIKNSFPIICNNVSVVEHNIEYNTTIEYRTVIEYKIMKENTKTLQEALNEFDWSELEQFSKTSDHYSRIPNHIVKNYLNVLQPFVEQESNVPVKKETKRNFDFDCKSEKYKEVLTGEQRESPVKVFDFVPFGFELDLLEIRLFELDGLVDKHIIIESTTTHRYAEKPLFLDRNIDRFTRLGFRDRIIHFIGDDSVVDKNKREDNSNLKSGDTWKLEKSVRSLLWTRFNENYDEVGEEDLLIHGDLDECPSFDYVNHLKNCKIRESPIGTKSIFYSNNFNWLHNSDHLALPSIYRKRDAKERNGFDRKGYRYPDQYSGYHLNRCMNIASLLYKHLSLAEGGTIARNDIQLLKNPSFIEKSIKSGFREFDTTSYVHKIDSGPIPHHALENRERFDYLFPK